MLTLAFPSAASACSCFRGDARRALQRADAAFIGVLRAKRVQPGGQKALYLFDVEEVVKGQLGRRLEVQSAAYGDACGLEIPVGGRSGLLIYREAKAWSSSLCSQIRPDELRRAAKPLPRPTGSGPIRFLVAGTFGDARVLALDRRGRTLAYGFGGGSAGALSVCPGSKRAVEIARSDETQATRLGVRDLRTMRLAYQVLLSGDGDEHFDSVHCGDANAREVFAFGTRYRDTATSRVVRIRGGIVSTIHRGSAERATFLRGLAFLGGGENFGVRSLDLHTARERIVTRLGVAAPVSVSPSGSKLAVHLSSDNRLATVDLSRRPATVARGPRLPGNTSGGLVWLTERRFGFFPGGGDSDRAAVYDASFRRVGGFKGWDAVTTVAREGTAYGVGGGKLRSARLPNGPARVLRTFFSPEIYDLAAVPAAVRFQARSLTLACIRG